MATLGWPSMIAVLGGLGAAFAWATTMICATRAARLIGATSVLAWVMLIGLVLTLPWALIRGVPEVDGNATRWLILAGVGNCVGLLLVYTGVRIGKVGVVAPIVSTEGAIAALIAVAAGEQLAPGTGAALVVIAVGIVLAAASRDSSGSGEQNQRPASRALRCCCRSVVRSEPLRDGPRQRGAAGGVGHPAASCRRRRGYRVATGTRRAPDVDAPRAAVPTRRGSR